MNKSIFLLGANGQLGKELEIVLSGYDLTSLKKSDLDVTNIENVNSVFQNLNQGIVINASAFTNVDEAESNFEQANKVNAQSLRTISKICQNSKSILIHFSTDYVFDGEKTSPYTEEDKTNPINAYGRSKLLGEEEIKKNLEDFYIFRTSWVYGKFGKNFPKTIIDLMQTKEELNIVGDQTGIPTSTNLLAHITKYFIEQINSQSEIEFGVYNAVPDGKTSWYIFAKYIYKVLKRKYPSSCKTNLINETSSKIFKRDAARPKNSILDNKKIKNKMQQFKMYNWETYLDRFLDSYLDNLLKK